MASCTNQGIAVNLLTQSINGWITSVSSLKGLPIVAQRSRANILYSEIKGSLSGDNNLFNKLNSPPVLIQGKKPNG